MFLVLLVPLLCRFGSSCNAILLSSHTTGVWTIFLANFKILLPKPRPCWTAICGGLPRGAALYLSGCLRRMFAGKWARVTPLYLATKVLPSGRVTLLGVSFLIIIILSLAIFSSFYPYSFLNSMIFLGDQQGFLSAIIVYF